MPVSAEGRVEHQKLNQVAALVSPGWVFGVQLDYSCRLKSVPPDAEKVVPIGILRSISLVSSIPINLYTFWSRLITTENLIFFLITFFQIPVLVVKSESK